MLMIKIDELTKLNMALILQLSSSSLITRTRNHRAKSLNLFAKSQDPSSAQSTEDAASSTEVSPQKKLGGAGLGFGPSISKRKQKGKRETTPVIRRIPIEKPKFDSQPARAQPQEPKGNESAFILAWLGLGAIIIVEGVVLSASGFLPEQWDNFFVKY
ncbi:unnamed protein product, partial [Cuscuta epithymum]